MNYWTMNKKVIVTNQPRISPNSNARTISNSSPNARIKQISNMHKTTPNKVQVSMHLSIQKTPFWEIFSFGESRNEGARVWQNSKLLSGKYLALENREMKELEFDKILHFCLLSIAKLRRWKFLKPISQSLYQHTSYPIDFLWMRNNVLNNSCW